MQYIDMEKYIEYLRMDTLPFHELLHLIKPKIEKQHAVRSPISAFTHLEICLYAIYHQEIPCHQFRLLFE